MKVHITEELSVLKHTMHFFKQGQRASWCRVHSLGCHPTHMLRAKFFRMNGVHSCPKVYDTTKNSGNRKVNVKYVPY